MDRPVLILNDMQHTLLQTHLKSKKQGLLYLKKKQIRESKMILGVGIRTYDSFLKEEEILQYSRLRQQNRSFDAAFFGDVITQNTDFGSVKMIKANCLKMGPKK